MEDQSYFINNSKFYALHFLVHGIHHAFPSDFYRLVFPPILGYPIVYIFFITPLSAILTDSQYYPFLFGTACMYLSYEMIHYHNHHSDPAEGTWLKEMKIYHMKHHYKNGVMGFGVSSRLWDKVFSTELGEK
jgi:4-hydroxysphinganine ceramide fatty acyl 2-hydroxylase